MATPLNAVERLKKGLAAGSTPARSTAMVLQGPRAPQMPAAPQGFAPDEIGKFIYWDMSTGRTTTNPQETFGPFASPDRFSERFVQLYYNPASGSLTDRQSPIPVRAGMDLTNIDPELLQRGMVWAEQDALARSMENRALSSANQSARYQMERQEAQVATDRRAAAASTELEALVNTRIEVSRAIGSIDINNFQARNQLFRQQRDLTQKIRDLKDQLLTPATTIQFRGMQGQEENLELAHPETRNVGWKIINAFDELERKARGLIGQEEAGGHRLLPWMNDVVQVLGQVLGGGIIAPVVEGFTAIGRSRQLHREMLQEMVGPGMDSFLEVVTHPGDIEINEVLPLAASGLISWFATFLDGMEDNLENIDHSLDQVALATHDLGASMLRGENPIFLMGPEKTAELIEQLENTGDRTPIQDLRLKSLRVERARMEQTEDFRVRSEAMFTEQFRALDNADASELEMTGPEYNAIYRTAQDKLREALDMHLQRSDIPQPGFKYSWRLIQDGATRKEKFKEAVVSFMMTAHRMPFDWEFEEIADRFTDPATELVGAVAFDPLNYIPGFVMTEALGLTKGLVSITKSGLARGFKAVPGFLDGAVLGRVGLTRPWFSIQAKAMSEWFTKLSIRSMATQVKYRMVEPMQMIGMRVNSVDELVVAIDAAVDDSIDIGHRWERGLSSRQGSNIRQVIRDLGYLEDTVPDGVQALKGYVRAGQVRAIDNRIVQINRQVGLLRQVALSNGVDISAVTDDMVSRAAAAWGGNPANIAGDIGDVVSQAYLGQHKLWRGSRLLDEGSLAWFAKHYKITEGEAVKLLGGAQISKAELDGLIRWWDIGMRIWKSAVLTLRPGFTVINFLDSLLRATLSGANPFQSMDEIVDAIHFGFIPPEIMGRFAGTDIPGFGNVAEQIMKGDLPMYGFHDIFGFGFRNTEGNILLKFEQGMRAVNTAFEFSLSTQLYARQFGDGWGIVQRLIRGRLDDLKAGLDEAGGGVLEQAWRQGGGATGEADNLLKQVLEGKGLFVVKPELVDELAEIIGPADAQQYWSRISTRINDVLRNRSSDLLGQVDDDLIAWLDQIISEERLRLIQERDRTMLHFALNKDMGGQAIAEGEGLGKLKIDDLLPTDRDNLQAEYEQLTRRSWDPSTTPEELTAVRGRIVEIDNILRPAFASAAAAPEVGPAISAGVDELKIAADDMFGETLQGELRADGIRYEPKYIGEKQRAGHALTISRAKINHLKIEISERVKLLSTRAQEVAALGGDVATLAAADADLAYRQMVYLAQLDDALTQIYSGPFREWMLEWYPGPKNKFFAPTGALRGKLWDAYNSMRAEIFNSAAKMFDSNAAAVAAGNIPELLPTRISILKDFGVDLEYNDFGELIAFQFKYEKNPQRYPPMLVALSEELGWKPSMGMTFQEYMDMPFVRPDMLPSKPIYRQIGDVLDPKMEDWWDSVLQQEDGPLARLELMYRGFLDETGQPVLRSPGALIAQIDKQIAEAVAEGNNQLAELYRLRKRYLIDEYQTVFHALDPSNPLQPNFPPPAELPMGMRNWLAASNEVDARVAIADRLLVELQQDLKIGLEDGSWRLLMDETQRGDLVRAAEQLAKLQQEAIETVNYGGNFLGHDFGDGAVSRVNEVMIDYARTTEPQRLIQKVFPFLRFPQKSLPFWMETMFTHPALPAFYAKYIQTSRRYAYERGATNSRGEQLPRLTGYLPIPGTDKWWNPLAPFSFRFVFPKVTPRYDESDADDPLLTQIIDWAYEYGTGFGFNPAPWVSGALQGTGVLNTNVHPRWALVPQQSLIPPFAARFVGQQLRKYGFANAPDLLTPEAPWKDALIEVKMLEVALAKLSEPGLTEGQRQRIAQEIEQAMIHRNTVKLDGSFEFEAGAQLWLDARDAVEGADYSSRVLGYFTSIYPKEFAADEADLLALRDQINMLKYTLNNEAGAVIFNMDPDVDKRWDFYRDQRYNTPEGWIADLYGARRYTIVDGVQLRGEERNEYIAQNILESQQTRARYEAINKLRQEYLERLSNIDIGAPWEEKQPAYLEFIEQMAKIEADPQYGAARTEWTIGWKPKRLVWEDLRDLFWATIEKTAPVFRSDGDLSYGDYLKDYEKWSVDIGPMSVLAAKAFWDTFNSIGWMDPTINGIPDILERLQLEASADGLRVWKLSRDTALEALARVWTEKYWQEHWFRMEGKEGIDFEIAQREFYGWMAQQNGDTQPMHGQPVGPSAETLFGWTQEMYPGRFTEGQLVEALGDKEVLSADERMQRKLGSQVGPELAALEDQVWKLYAMIPPGNSDEFIDEYVRLGGPFGEEILAIWRAVGSADAFKDQDELKKAAEIWGQVNRNLGFATPSNDEMLERKEAGDLNDQFRELISQTLGTSFFQEQAYYFRLSGAERRDYREENPDFDDALAAYGKLRDAYAVQFPVWGKFYTPQAAEGGTSGAGGAGGGGGGGRSAAGRGSPRVSIPPSLPAGYRGGQTGEEVIKKGLGKGGVTARPVWPRWLLDKLGDAAIAELNAKAANDVKSEDWPARLKKLIKNLDTRDPDAKVEAETQRIYNQIRRGGGGGPQLKV